MVTIWLEWYYCIEQYPLISDDELQYYQTHSYVLPSSIFSHYSQYLSTQIDTILYTIQEVVQNEHVVKPLW